VKHETTVLVFQPERISTHASTKGCLVHTMQELRGREI